MQIAKTSKELEEKINIEKELLSAMPRNNEKNIEKYNEKIDELIETYRKFQKELVNLMKKEYDKAISTKPSEQIDNLDKRIKVVGEQLNLINDYKTSYEKMKLDKLIYGIEHYYKENFEKVNKQIIESINQFKSVGINLKSEDFNYTAYAKTYMNVFFNELEHNKINSDIIKNQFENLYWKCPDLMLHIELSFRNIYLRNESKIDKYFEKEKQEVLKKWVKTPEEIITTYRNLNKEQNDLIKLDKKYILNEFLTGKLKADEFTQDKLKKSYEKIMSDNLINKKKENEDEVQENINKFLSTLCEYRNYLKYKFIVDDIKKIYDEKDQHKKSYQDTLKKITKEEKSLSKINKKMTKKSIFRIKRIDSSERLMEQNEIVLRLHDLYNELDLNKFYNKIATKLNKNSTIYDALCIGESSYDYLVMCIINNDNKITKEGIEEKISDIHKFIEASNLTLINNISFVEERDLSLVIKDRYKLLDFNVEKEDLTSTNLNNIISTLEIIRNDYGMKKAKLKIEKVNELLSFKKILKL